MPTETATVTASSAEQIAEEMLEISRALKAQGDRLHQLEVQLLMYIDRENRRKELAEWARILP